MAEPKTPVAENFSTREDPAYLEFLENSFMATKDSSVREAASTDLILRRLTELESRVAGGVHLATHGLTPAVAAGGAVRGSRAAGGGGALGKAEGEGAFGTDPYAGTGGRPKTGASDLAGALGSPRENNPPLHL